MPNFVFDYLWSLAALGVVVGLTSLYAGIRSGSRSVIAGAIFCLLIGAALFGIDYWVVSPTEQIRAVLAQIIQAAKEGDAKTIDEAVSSQYSDGTRDHDTLVSLIHSRIDHADIENVSLAGLEFAHQEGDIQTSFVAHVSGRYQGMNPGQAYPVRLKILFRREGDTWRMISIHRYDPIQSAKEVPLDSLH
ncbi:hypothetical protein K2Y11_07250 [bacterium]|nr:hypothetical protein [bacterium]